MKKKRFSSAAMYGLIVIGILFSVSGCSALWNQESDMETQRQSQDSFNEQETRRDQEEESDYALKTVEMSQKEKDKTTEKISALMEKSMSLYSDYKNKGRTGNSEEVILQEETVHKMIEAAAADGSSVTCGSRDYNMTNYEKIDEALIKAEEGKEAEAEFYQISKIGVFRYYHLWFCNKELVVTFASAVFGESMGIDVQQMEKIKAYRWEYTEKGWLIWEKALTRNQEMDMHIFYRILPLDDRCRDMMEHYIVPVSYLSNNLFLEDWDENSMEKIEFNDLFDYLYAMSTGRELNEEAYSDGIPKEEFEETIRLYFDIPTDKIEQYARYDSARGKYPWTAIRALNRVPQIQPFPEVVRCEEKGDGTLKVYVEAIYVEEGTDYAFGHVVTFRRKEDGRLVYAGNQVDRENVRLMPAYRARREFADDGTSQ